MSRVTGKGMKVRPGSPFPDHPDDSVQVETPRESCSLEGGGTTPTPILYGRPVLIVSSDGPPKSETSDSTVSGTIPLYSFRDETLCSIVRVPGSDPVSSCIEGRVETGLPLPPSVVVLSTTHTPSPPVHPSPRRRRRGVKGVGFGNKKESLSDRLLLRTGTGSSD